MDFTNVNKIVETSSYQEACSYLELGWKLLAVLQYKDEADGIAHPIYSLGWPKDEEPVLPETKSKFSRLS